MFVYYTQATIEHWGHWIVVCWMITNKEDKILYIHLYNIEKEKKGRDLFFRDGPMEW